MQAPRIMRRINRVLTNPLVNNFAGVVPPFAVVHHRGRRTGRAYRTPIVVFPTAQGFVTPLPYGTDTDWCLNLLAAGRCTLETTGQKVAVGRPRIVRGDTAIPLFPFLLRPGLRLAGLPGYLLVDRRRGDLRRRPQVRRARRAKRS